MANTLPEASVQFCKQHGKAFLRWLKDNTVKCVCTISFGPDEQKQRGVIDADTVLLCRRCYVPLGLHQVCCATLVPTPAAHATAASAVLAARPRSRCALLPLCHGRLSRSLASLSALATASAAAAATALTATLATATAPPPHRRPSPRRPRCQPRRHPRRCPHRRRRHCGAAATTVAARDRAAVTDPLLPQFAFLERPSRCVP